MKTLELPDRAVKKKTVKPDIQPVALPVEKTGTPLPAAGALRSQWTDITPEMAARWLKNNFRNRPMSDEVIRAYARDMLNGSWQATHQGIAFNDRDELIDGQHRLMAIIRARKTVCMMVTFGLPSVIQGTAMTTMDCVDRGRTRSVADQLKIQHCLKHGTHIAQIASAIAGLCHERIRRLSVGQTLDIYRLFKVPIDFIIANRSKSPGLKSAGVLAGFTFVLATDTSAEIFKVPVARMFFALNSGEELDRYPMIKQLHDFLIGDKAGLLMKSMNRSLAELTVQAVWIETRIAAKKQAAGKLELGPEGVRHYRDAQVDRVVSIAKLFRLPEVAKDDAKQAISVPKDTRGFHMCKCGQIGKVKINETTWECIRCYVNRK